MIEPEDPILEQIDYYRARAGEYDDWFLRRGRYDRGPEENARWASELDEVRRALEGFAPRGDVLEIAAGTGLWTEELVDQAEQLTCLDASPETLEINRGKIAARGAAHKVEYVCADVFAWTPSRKFDVAFLGFWLSHVPEDRFDAFWGVLDRALKPEGRVFLVDSRYTPRSTARDHALEGSDATRVTRRLGDGREFRIVKVFYQTEALAGRLRAMGWNGAVRATRTYFLHGSVSRGGDRVPSR